MTRSTLLTVPALIVLASVPAAAQEPLSLEEAVRAALSHNAALRAARSGVEEASALAEASRSDYFPRVTVSESWQRGDGPVFAFSSLLSARDFSSRNFAITSLNHPSPLSFFRTGVLVEQTVFDGRSRRAASDAAAQGRVLAESSAKEAEAGVAVAVTEAFGRVLLGEASLRAAEAGLAAALEDLARAERRRDAGMATEADVLSLAVHVADLRRLEIQSRGEVAVAAADLNHLMGAPAEAGVRLHEPSEPPPLEAEPETAALLAEAEAARAEIRGAAAKERIAAANRRQARGAFLPRATALAGIEADGTAWNERESSWMVGADLRWTFSTGGGETARARASAASMERARAETEEIRGAVRAEVIGALRRAESARARYEVGVEAVAQAKESQRILRDRFEAGVAPVNDVLRASTALLDAEAGRAAALADSLAATAALRRALGRTP